MLRKRKREEKIKKIFIDFDKTLIDNELGSDEIINDENFVEICYKNKKNYLKILNKLNELKSEYEFYILSRNENTLLKGVVEKMFPKIFKGIFLYIDLSKVNVREFEDEYKIGKKNDVAKLYALKKRELVKNLLKKKKEKKKNSFTF